MVGHEAKEMKAEKKLAKPVEMSFGGMLKKFMQVKQGMKSQNSEMPHRRTASFAEPQRNVMAGTPPMQPNKPITPAPESVAPESAGGNMKKGGKVMKKGGCTKMATGGIAKSNLAKGDLAGSKNFGRSTGEGIEKSYKANTKAVKHRQGDGCAQRGLTKIGRSKEM